MEKVSRNMLIIASDPENYSTQAIEQEAKKRGHQVTVLTPDDFYLHVSDVNGHDKVFVKSKRVFKKNIDVVIPRIGTYLEFGAAIVHHWTHNIGIPTTSLAEGLLNASDKWRTIQLLSEHRVSVPRTTLMKKPEDFGALVNTVGGLPVVAKLLKGSQGKGVFILETNLGGSTGLQAFYNNNMTVMLQQFIETAKEEEQKSDLRIWVVNGQVVAAFRRLSLHEDFRSNYSISKAGEEVELTEEEKELAVKAADAVGLACAGVDIMRDYRNENKPYVIEVIHDASLKGIQTVTGINIAAAIVDYAETLCKNGRTKATAEEPAQQMTRQPARSSAHNYLSPLTVKAMSRSERKKLGI